MPIKILNYIIIVSLIGIAALSAKELVFPTKPTTAIAPILITPTAAPASTLPPLVNCQNKYFVFNKGATWKYRLTTTNTANKKTTTTTDFLTSAITESSPSSILVSVVTAKDKKTTISKLDCRQDGIYGVPFAILPTNSASFMQSLRLIPSETTLVQDKPWTESISLDGLVQLPIPNLSLGLKSQVNSRSQKTLYNQLRSSLMITSTLQLPQQGLESFFNGNLLEYELIEGIGVNQLKFNLNIKDISNISTQLSLVSFESKIAR